MYVSVNIYDHLFCSFFFLVSVSVYMSSRFLYNLFDAYVLACRVLFFFLSSLAQKQIIYETSFCPLFRVTLVLLVLFSLVAVFCSHILPLILVKIVMRLFVRQNTHNSYCARFNNANETIAMNKPVDFMMFNTTNNTGASVVTTTN